MVAAKEEGMRIIGLTGGIASGKTTVARMLAEMGAAIVDADQISRDAVNPGSTALGTIVDQFGPDVLRPDGTLDRTKLAQVVFGDPAARKRLEAILHPAIRQLAEQKLNELREAGNPLVFYVAPLLIEAGALSRVDEVWVVHVDRATQLRRLMARDGISEEEALQRIAAQMPMEEKRKYGRVVIENGEGIESTRNQVREIWDREISAGMSVYPAASRD